MISLKVDEDVKKQAQAVAKAMGLSLSALVNIHLAQIARTKRLEIDLLDIRPEPQTAKTAKIIEQIEAEIDRGEVYGPFESIDEFFDDLDNRKNDD